MFGFIEIISGAEDVLPLVPAVIKIVQKLKEHKVDPTLARVIEQVRLDTLDAAQGIRTELVEFLQDKTIDPQLSVPLKKLGDDLSWITDPIKKRRVQKCRDRIHEIHRSLTNSTDHLAAILACMQRTNGLANAYEVAAEVRGSLDKILLSEPPLREVIKQYLFFLDGYITKLQQP